MIFLSVTKLQFSCTFLQQLDVDSLLWWAYQLYLDEVPHSSMPLSHPNHGRPANTSRNLYIVTNHKWIILIFAPIESFHLGVAIQCGAITDYRQHLGFSLLTCIKTSREVIKDGSLFYANEILKSLWKECLSKYKEACIHIHWMMGYTRWQLIPIILQVSIETLMIFIYVI